MNNLTTLQEKAHKVFPKENKYYVDAFTVEIWNAAITEAIGALPGKEPKGKFSPQGSDESEDFNRCVNESRTNIGALLKV